MKVGTYADGRDIRYEESTRSFIVGDAPFTSEQVLAFDAAGQVTWVSDETRVWAQGLGMLPSQTTVAPPNATQPQAVGWFTRLPIWAKILFVLFFPISIPYGIWAMWKNRSFNQPVRIALTVVGSVLLIAFLVDVANDDAPQDAKSGNVTSSGSATSQSTDTEAESEPEPAPEPEPEPEPEPAPIVEEPAVEPVVEEPAVEPVVEEPALTMGQQQAIAKGEDYLDYTAFSRKGLIEQLVFEGFSTADATFAVDYIAPDWKAQAALKAQDYLDYSSFSRKGLIDQLVFEGFTKAQAEYGVKAVGY